jgi:sucrose phosphorylase
VTSATERRHETWRDILAEIYGAGAANEAAPALRSVLDSHPTASVDGGCTWDEHDAWLITYPDQFQGAGEVPLATLRRFFLEYIRPSLTGIHLLPFFPWSSDDGYGVLDYLAVDPSLGTWEDIEVLARDARLMVDAVINHLSAQSQWFRSFLQGDPAYAGFFRTVDPRADVSRVTRPRDTPLLTPFTTAEGEKMVWTTFSADQVDLDYRNPAVLTRIVDVVLSYAARGVRAIRLDAVGFLWKDEATTSSHLPQTHLIVQLIRACLDATYPDVLLVTETNVPHTENISYFGDGTRREAQAVYQFSLPPLVLHSFATENASLLKEWAAMVSPDLPATTFLNFLASHDGVGLRPVEGILPAGDLEGLVATAKVRGGRVGYRRLGDGTSTPYELNGTWFDLLAGTDDTETTLSKHVASHAIMFALRGIPAVYVQSLLAGRNDLEGMRRSGMARAINRRKFTNVRSLEAVLQDPGSLPARCLAAMRKLLAWRSSSVAFHPDSNQVILATPPQVIGIERTHHSGTRARVYVNVSRHAVETETTAQPPTFHGLRAGRSGDVIELGPWGVAWLT